MKDSLNAEGFTSQQQQCNAEVIPIANEHEHYSERESLSLQGLDEFNSPRASQLIGISKLGFGMIYGMRKS